MKDFFQTAQDNPGQTILAVAAVVLLTDRFKEDTKKSREKVEKLESDMKAFQAQHDANVSAATQVAAPRGK